MELLTRASLFIFTSLLLCCQVCPQEGDEGGRDENLPDTIGLAASSYPLSMIESTTTAPTTSSVPSSLSSDSTSSRELEEVEDNVSSVKHQATDDEVERANATTNTSSSKHENWPSYFNKTDVKSDTQLNVTLEDFLPTTMEPDFSWNDGEVNGTLFQDKNEEGTVFDKSAATPNVSLAGSKDTSFTEGNHNISAPHLPNSTGINSKDSNSISNPLDDSIGPNSSPKITDLPNTPSTPIPVITSTSHLSGSPGNSDHLVPASQLPVTTRGSATSAPHPAVHRRPRPPQHTPPHAPKSPPRNSGGSSGRREIAGMDPLALGIGICIPILLVIVVILSVFCYRKYKKGGRGYITLDDFGTFEGMQNPNYDGEL